MEKDDSNLDMTAMVTAITPSGSVAMHPFQMGFRHAMEQMREKASYVWRPIVRWMNPAPFPTPPEIRHRGGQRAEAVRLTQNASPVSPSLNVERMDQDLVVREGASPSLDPQSRQGDGKIASGAEKARGVVDPEERRAPGSPTQDPAQERSGVVSDSSPVPDRETRQVEADANIRSNVLKMSHSRLEDTDILLDTALLASGMGGVWMLEHLADLAIHTRLKPSPPAQQDRIAGHDSPHPSKGREHESRKEDQPGSRTLTQGGAPDGTLKTDAELAARPSINRFRR
jgi:hypothetical protein